MKIRNWLRSACELEMTFREYICYPSKSISSHVFISLPKKMILTKLGDGGGPSRVKILAPRDSVIASLLSMSRQETEILF